MIPITWIYRPIIPDPISNIGLAGIPGEPAYYPMLFGIVIYAPNHLTIIPANRGRGMIQLGDVLKAVGPNASIVFAAWIFMGFLQQRYDSAIDRYREAVGDYRANDHAEERAGNLKDQILTYRNRCKLMSRATLIGLIAAIFLIASLIFGVLDVIVPDNPAITASGTAATVLGFLLVILATLIVIAEGRIVHRQLNDELRDVPDLADGAAGPGHDLRH